MNLLEFIRTLQNFEKPVFTINDAAKIIGADKEYARLYLHRLKEKGIMDAVERGELPPDNSGGFLLHWLSIEMPLTGSSCSSYSASIQDID